MRIAAIGWSALVMAVLAGRVQADGERPPNIVLCMADDQGWGDVSYNGAPQVRTPNLDAMAAAGLRFDRFYAAAPVCSPTRGSVLTGRHPNRFGCFKWGYTLRPQELTLAEALSAAGYVCGHFGKWHLGSVRATSPLCPGHSGFEHWLSSPNFFDNDPLMSREGRVVHTRGESSHVVVAAALEFIRAARSQKRPFLAVIWFGSPHLPHRAAARDRRPYAHLDPKLQNYYGEIAGVDRAMGELRAALQEMGIGADTLVWYTSDNGPRPPARRAASTGGLRGLKGTLWEGGLRVPAIIEWPRRIRSARVSAAPAGTVDIMPTVLDLTGVARPAGAPPFDGVSLRPLLAGEPLARARPLGFWDYPVRGRGVKSTALLKALEVEQKAGHERDAAELYPGEGRIDHSYPLDRFPGNAAWMEGDYKLHRRAGKSGGATYLLYNLDRDPAESTDLAAAEPERLARMKTALEAWQRSVLHSLNGGDYRKDSKKRSARLQPAR